LRVEGSGFRVQGSGFRVQGSGFRVQGSGFRVEACVGAEKPASASVTVAPSARSMVGRKRAVIFVVVFTYGEQLLHENVQRFRDTVAGVHLRRIATSQKCDQPRDNLRPSVDTPLKNNHFTERCSGSEAGSYLRRIDLCITQL